MHCAVEQEIHELIQAQGRITFAQYMQTCLYSPRGGFFSTRSERIGTHFGTAPDSHPAFGALIARQLQAMWQRLGEPRVFHCVEVGCGDGTLARAIMSTAWRTAPRFAQALYYVAADYAPGVYAPRGASAPIRRVQTAGVRAFHNLVGCVLCNELVDNFPVHRFAIVNGRVKEVFVTLAQGALVETLDEPSTARIPQRLDELGLSLPDGYRGEINLVMTDWVFDLSAAIDRGFILTIDYGELAADLYSPERRDGAIVCYRQHQASQNPYQHPGEQDITTLVDFSSLMRLGERHGLTTVGYTRQSEFLKSLGFASHLERLEHEDLSEARKTLARMALMSLIDPQQYGEFKVLVQAKGIYPGRTCLGFEKDAERS